ATVGTLAALHHRNVAGEGQHVEVSLMGAALAGLLNQASGYLATGEDPPRLGNRHPSIAPYQTFEAADGWLVVACGNDNQFRALAGVCDLDHLAGDERFSTNTARVANVDALDEILTDTFRRQPVAHWVHELNRAGVPAGPINTVGQAFRLAADWASGRWWRPPGSGPWRLRSRSRLRRPPTGGRHPASASTTPRSAPGWRTTPDGSVGRIRRQRRRIRPTERERD